VGQQFRKKTGTKKSIRKEKRRQREQNSRKEKDPNGKKLKSNEGEKKTLARRAREKIRAKPKSRHEVL